MVGWRSRDRRWKADRLDRWVGGGGRRRQHVTTGNRYPFRPGPRCIWQAAFAAAKRGEPSSVSSTSPGSGQRVGCYQSGEVRCVICSSCRQTDGELGLIGRYAGVTGSRVAQGEEARWVDAEHWQSCPVTVRVAPAPTIQTNSLESGAVRCGAVRAGLARPLDSGLAAGLSVAVSI